MLFDSSTIYWYFYLNSYSNFFVPVIFTVTAPGKAGDIPWDRPGTSLGHSLIVTGFIFIRSFSNIVTIMSRSRHVPGLSQTCPRGSHGAVTVSVTGTKKLMYVIHVKTLRIRVLVRCEKWQFLPFSRILGRS